jgi:hypothetical protein
MELAKSGFEMSSDIKDLSGVSDVRADVVTIGLGAPPRLGIITDAGICVGWKELFIDGMLENICELIEANPSESCLNPSL